MPSKFELFKQRWIDCQACELCESRKQVVLLRGSVPSKVLFIGEAPGEGEDVTGLPFYGPAGKLLDRIIAKATKVSLDKFAYTNLICCIPRDEAGIKTSKPPKFAIEACSERLRECVQLVQPKLVVWVGDDAKKYGPKILAKHSPAFKTVHITHPGNILRTENEYAKNTVIKRNIVILRDALELVL